MDTGAVGDAAGGLVDQAQQTAGDTVDQTQVDANANVGTGDDGSRRR